MEKLIAYCGGRCDTCAILLATREADDAKKHEMSKTEGGRLLNNKCPVRKCAVEKGVETCAHCSEYACEKLRET
jgi:hypothetical protein